ncbi:MAG: hypothetical protein WA949_13430, partial [Phormidesmis sp.]
LETLTICHTSARKLAAAPALVREGDALAVQGEVEQAIERYQAARDWGMDINPARRAQTQSASSPEATSPKTLPLQ